MNTFQVKCTMKSHPHGGHEHITHIGGYTSQPWMITKAQAVANIDARVEGYYTVDPTNGKRSEVGVVREAGKQPYLRTHADGYYNNNLLALNACPIAA